MRKKTCLVAVLFGGLACAQIGPEGAAAYFDFGKGIGDLVVTGRTLELHGARWGKVEDPMQARLGRALEFTDAGQYAQFQMTRSLEGVTAATVGGWFYTRRWGEQSFVSRGLPEIAPGGQRMFRPQSDWVDFTLGTDQHGFLLGTVHGNGSMPFPLVTINEVPINRWNQLVVVKTADGYQKFYQNGTLIHTDHEGAAAPRIWPFRDAAPGEPVRLSVAQGGLIGEVWIYPRELGADEIRKDFNAKRERYHPAFAGERVLLREMDERPSAGLWKEPPTARNWAHVRNRILEGVFKVFGPFPKQKVPLDPEIISEDDRGSYLRRKVSIQVQQDDRMPAYILIPKNHNGRLPAVLCFYGTTSGAGKETTVGLSGPKPGTPPVKNRDFAVTIVNAGYVAFAADYLRDGERISRGRAPYDTTDFYREFPNWSIHGKDVWDNMRAIDYLQSLDFVDPEKIGMVGHSYGGHSTIFAAALEPRIKVAVSNGPVSDFIHHGMHWGVPIGGRNSQSLPAMRPYVLDHTLPPPLTFYEFTALIAPRPLLVGEAVGERRPMEEENAAAVRQVYSALGVPDRVRYHWYAGDHDFPPHAQQAAVHWFRKWFAALDKESTKR